MCVRLISACLVAVVCCGCRPGAPASGVSPGGPTGSRLWTGPADGSGVPGLDGGGDVYFVGKLLLVWAASGAGGGGGSSTAGPDGIKGDGQVRLRGGRTVSFSYRMPDERTGTAVIDGKEYQFADGRVFLVRLDGDKVVVKQHDMNLRAIDLAHADFAAIGKGEPVIKAFFEAGK